MEACSQTNRSSGRSYAAIPRMKTMEKTVSVTEFKAKCLKILDELESQGIVITRRGQPVARLTPMRVVDNS